MVLKPQTCLLRCVGCWLSCAISSHVPGTYCNLQLVELHLILYFIALLAAGSKQSLLPSSVRTHVGVVPLHRTHSGHYVAAVQPPSMPVALLLSVL